MKTYIVLLRGINAGGKNLVPMKELKVLLEDNKFESVATYIQSGNIVLKYEKSPEIEIETLIQTTFGFSAEVMVLDEEEFYSSVSNNPFQDQEGKEVHFYYCKERPKINKIKLEEIASQTEQYELIDGVFYLSAPDGIGRSKLVANIEACLGVTATGRNLNTVRKLSEMIENA
ncbi:DUF1697 domain-containing protein [Microbulbifer sp. ZKSA006]|uniref:DUF1697 domain-containing protein n=1 Tax=Microbulbifer sp. ZKSA006 TaxID=3243390 RepID=UPI00403993A7